MRRGRLLLLALTLAALLALSGCGFVLVENHLETQVVGSPVSTEQPLD